MSYVSFLLSYLKVWRQKSVVNGNQHIVLLMDQVADGSNVNNFQGWIGWWFQPDLNGIVGFLEYS